MADNAVQRMADWLRAKDRGQAVMRPDLLAKAATRPQPPTAPVAPTTTRTPGGPSVRITNVGPSVPQPVLLPPTPKTTALGLPVEAPCAVCGGPALPGVPTWGPWRVHDPCRPLLGDPTGRVQAAARALGITEVSRTDALLLSFDVSCYCETHPEPTWTTEPTRHRMRWSWVDRKGLVRALAGLPDLRAEAGLELAPCTTGRCAWCGCSTSLGWHDAGHSWPDGSPAPLCVDCHRVWTSHGEPTFPDQVGLALSECVTGAPAQMGVSAPTGLVPYAELASGLANSGPESQTSELGKVEDPRPLEAWSHLDPDALRSFRFEAWSRYGLAYCPPEHRQEVEEWARARDAEWAARAAERSAAEADRANVHGF